jgi:hypothetical protein
MLKSRKIDCGLWARAVLNWKVSGPGFVSVAVTLSVIDVPKGAGDGCKALNPVIVTAAPNGRQLKAAVNSRAIDFIQTPIPKRSID